MNKSQVRTVETVRQAKSLFDQNQNRAHLSSAAKLLSFEIRASKSFKARRELMAIADELGLTGLSDFVVVYWE